MPDHQLATPDEVIAAFTPGEQVAYATLVQCANGNQHWLAHALIRAQHAGAKWARHLVEALLRDQVTRLVVERTMEQITAELDGTGETP